MDKRLGGRKCMRGRGNYLGGWLDGYMSRGGQGGRMREDAGGGGSIRDG